MPKFNDFDLDIQKKSISTNNAYGANHYSNDCQSFETEVDCETRHVCVESRDYCRE